MMRVNGWLCTMRWMRCRFCVWCLAGFSCLFEQGDNCRPILKCNSFHGFRPGVLKWVISVTFELFGLFRDETSSKGGAAMTVWLRIFPSLAGACRLLTSVAWGTLYFVPWSTLLYLAGSLPWRFLPWWTLFYCGSLPWRSLLYRWAHDLDVWGSTTSSLSAGCWAVCGWGKISSVHLLLSVGPPLLFLWNKTWDIF